MFKKTRDQADADRYT
jgi:hypothetical protein